MEHCCLHLKNSCDLCAHFCTAVPLCIEVRSYTFLYDRTHFCTMDMQNRGEVTIYMRSRPGDRTNRNSVRQTVSTTFLCSTKNRFHKFNYEQ